MTTLKVSFNSIQEFIAELQQHPPNVDSVVRLTKSYRSSAVSPNIYEISLIAGYLRRTGQVVQVIELNHYCGEHWPHNDAMNDKVSGRADGFLEFIETKAKELGWTIGAGAYELNQRNP